MNTVSDTKRLSWELPDAIWQRMEACIPPKRGKEGHPRTVNLRRITEGIFYILRTGISCKPVHGSALARPARSTTTLPRGSRLGCLPSYGSRPWRSMMT
jgi:transposase